MVKKTVKKTTTKARTSVPEVTTSQAMVQRKMDLTKYYSPAMVVLLVGAAFFIGRLTAQVENLKNVAGSAITAPTGGEAVAPQGTRKLDIASLKNRAKKLGLDSGKFDQCLDNGTNAKRVAAEQAEGTTLGVSGTPSFLINGILVVGALPQTSFESVIDAELKNGTGDAAAKALGESGVRQKLSLTDSYVRGDKNAKIKIVEFTDFECPFCEKSFPTISALEEKYKGKISLEYKSFPLSFHASAQKAAEAALCAGEQGKFWEMHDDLFTAAE